MRSLQNSKAKNRAHQSGKIPDGRVYVDLTGRGQGRGAYICSARNCIELAKKKNLISRALKVDVPFEIYEELLQKHEELLQKIDNIGNANQ